VCRLTKIRTFKFQILIERGNLGDLEINMRSELKWILYKYASGFWWGNLRERNHWRDPDLDGRIILR